MNIEVIVKVHSGSTAQEYGAMLEVRESETVAPDRAPKHGEEGYGRPAAEHPWLRADKVLEHLAIRARARARGLLREREDAERGPLLVAQEAWDEKHTADDIPY